MSNKRIPNLSVTDGFDFVKKIWGSLPIPSVMNPTTDLDELDKRISDLKAVEQWLNVNLSMLRATIQGLEVQRGTIATIKSFSSNLGLGGARCAQNTRSRTAIQRGKRGSGTGILEGHCVKCHRLVGFVARPIQQSGHCRHIGFGA